jgi:MFS family permease
VCGALWGLGTLMTGLAGGLGTLLLARFVVGLGESPIVPASARALTAWMEPERRGFSQGITHACARLGNASTPILVAGLITAFSWHIAFIVLGAASLASSCGSGITATTPPIIRALRPKTLLVCQ